MSDPGRTDQIISQFLLKTLHAVLAARIPHLLRPCSPARRRDRWFNLVLGDLPPALETHWHPAVMDPLIIDVILSHRGASGPESVVERWTVHCDPASPSAASTSAASTSAASTSVYRKTYKKSVLLIRSLYSVLRLLPAYRIFRMLCDPNHSYNYDLSYRISSFALPFSREEEAKLKPYNNFAPIPTQIGLLSLFVMYRPRLSEFKFEVSAVIPPMIIPDYVGSPAAEPMKPFPSSLPSRGNNSTSLRACASPDPPTLARPHSWASPPMGHHPLSGDMHPPDAFRLSPPFSASPTPSPPTYSSNSLQSRLRSESAPVTIPQLMIGKSQALHSRNLSDPTRSLLPPMSPRSSRVADHSSQESPSESSRSFRKLEGLKLGDYYSNLYLYTANKGSFKDGRDDSGRFSGVLSSVGSPRFGISRSSSRLSIQDDFDEGDFSYPFAVDDVDTSDAQASKQRADPPVASTSSHRSQDAALGVLIHMLKTAPPLRSDHSYSSQSSRSGLGGECSSSSFISRKASDALEELQGYRELKDILLSQSGTKLHDSVKDTQN